MKILHGKVLSISDQIARDCRSVKDLSNALSLLGQKQTNRCSQALPEAQFLSLSIKKAGKKTRLVNSCNFENPSSKQSLRYMDEGKSKECTEVCEEQLEFYKHKTL